MRGQAHTLEGVLGALLVLGGVLFALQATAVTPLTASTSNQHIENLEESMAAGVLATADANGTLRETVVYWNTEEDSFVGSPQTGFYVVGGPPNAFGAALNGTFDEENIAFNVYLRYRSATDSSWRERTLVYMGTPSDNAVAASRTVVLLDDTELSSDSPVNVSTAAANGFYARDISKETKLFNVVEVRIVVWRM